MAPSSSEPAQIAVVLNVAKRRALLSLVEEITESMRSQLDLSRNIDFTKISTEKTSHGTEPDTTDEKDASQVSQQHQPPSSELIALRKAAISHFNKWRDEFLHKLQGIINVREDNKVIEARKKRQDQLTAQQSPPPSAEDDTSTDDEKDSLESLQTLYTPTETRLTTIPLHDRKEVLSSILILLLSTGHYSAYSRTFILYLTSSLHLPLSFINNEESEIAQTMLEATAQAAQAEKAKSEKDGHRDGLSAEAEAAKRKDENQASRYWKVGLASVAGAAVIGITGGLAAPLVAGAVGGLMGSVGLGGLASFLGVFWANGALVGTLFGAYGARMTGEMMDKYAREVQDFRLLPLQDVPQPESTAAATSSTVSQTKDKPSDQALASSAAAAAAAAVKETRRLRVTIGINGWLTTSSSVTTPWACLSAYESEVFALRYEMDTLLKLGSALTDMVKSTAWKMLKSEIIKRTALAALWAAMWPLGVLSMASRVDNPFSLARNRSDKAGKILADALINKIQGERPVTLVGFSLGARVIYSCLQTLVERRAFGLVDTVVLVGAPTPSNREEWLKMKSVVSGKLFNVYSENDYILAFLYRATSIQLGVAGLQAVKDIDGVVDIDLSDKVKGHLRYPDLLPQILARCRFENVEGAHEEIEKEDDVDVDEDAVELGEDELKALSGGGIEAEEMKTHDGPYKVGDQRSKSLEEDSSKPPVPLKNRVPFRDEAHHDGIHLVDAEDDMRSHMEPLGLEDNDR